MKPRPAGCELFSPPPRTSFHGNTHARRQVASPMFGNYQGGSNVTAAAARGSAGAARHVDYPYMTTGDVAAYLGVSAGRVRQLVMTKALRPGPRIRNRRVFKRTEVERYKRARAKGSL